MCGSEPISFRLKDEYFMKGRLLQLLDGFQLVCDGEPVPLPGSAQRLMAFLALHPHPLRRVHVAGTLWLDSPEERGFANLRSTLWRLHQTGAGLVEADGGRLGLDPALRVDYREAVCLSRAMIDGPGAGLDWQPLVGELLPDWDDDWVIVEREHHRHLSLRALEGLSERLLAAGALPQALEIALAVFAREPLRETANRLLIKVHVAEGNSFEAIRQYRLYERLAMARIGLAPSSQMDELVRDLLPSQVCAPGAAA
jgi:DNA-binding SARP family transcriptional activator